MAEQGLEGRCILVVEDEYLLADDLRDVLTRAGAIVLGPVGSVEEATDLLSREARIDAAVLDINLHGGQVFPLADALSDKDVPFAFATGYDHDAIPARHADRPHVEKPFKGHRVATVLGGLMS